MPVTQNDLLLAVRERLDEYSEYQWLDTELRRWINEGAKDIARTTECLEDTATIVTTAGTFEYTPTALSNAVKLDTVEWGATGDERPEQLNYIDVHHQGQIGWGTQYAEGQPALFTTHGFPPNLKISLYPNPSVNGYMRVRYARLPAELTVDGTDGTSTVEVPEGWDDAVVDYAEMRALRKDRDPRWQEAKTQYEENRGNLNTTMIRHVNETGQFGVSGMSGAPMWLIGGDPYGW